MRKSSHPSLLSVCDQGHDFGVVGVMLVPLAGTFSSDQDPIPVLIQRQPDDVDRSDLSQQWRNAGTFLFSKSSKNLTDLITLLMDKSTDANTSVYLKFQTNNNGHIKSSQIVVDAEAFAIKVPEFAKDCGAAQ